MFDDLDDDDVTDLIPDSDIEKKEKEHRREQERRGRRMTVSEVNKIKRNVKTILLFNEFWYEPEWLRCEMSEILSKDFALKFTNPSIKISWSVEIARKHFERRKTSTIYIKKNLFYL